MSGPFHSFCVLLVKLQIFEYSNGKIGIFYTSKFKTFVLKTISPRTHKLFHVFHYFIGAPTPTNSHRCLTVAGGHRCADQTDSGLLQTVGFGSFDLLKTALIDDDKLLQQRSGADPGFSFGGGGGGGVGRKILCAHTHITSAEPNSLSARVQL